MSERFKELDEQWEGARVRFLGATNAQIQWGSNNDPNDVLTVGEAYDVESADVRSWHTKLQLVGFEGTFNSASFDRESPDEDRQVQSDE